jgi:hypothetical protein
MPKSHASIVPPNDPWQELNSSEDAYGYLSIYYSDDLSSLPVRWITKPGDNKSDPNLETLTYGLFSTCAPGMRAGVVKRKSRYLFFATSRKGQRILAGYYHHRWYAQGVFLDARDFCLAADEIRFVADPIPLKRVDRKCGTNVSRWFRNMRLLTGQECLRIVHLLREEPDATADYLSEINRLENFNLKHSGYRYPSWRQKSKFSWELAQDLVSVDRSKQEPGKVLNTSSSGLWKCQSCSQIVKNKALLKRCPHCGKVGTLKPK